MNVYQHDAPISEGEVNIRIFISGYQSMLAAASYLPLALNVYDWVQ